MKAKSPRFIHVIFILILITLLAIFASCCKVVSNFAQYSQPIVEIFLHTWYIGESFTFNSEGTYLIPPYFGISSIKITDGFRVDCYRNTNGNDFISLSADTPDFTKRFGDQNRLWMNDTVKKLVITRTTDETNSITYRNFTPKPLPQNFFYISEDEFRNTAPIEKNTLVNNINMSTPVKYTISFSLYQRTLGSEWRNILFIGADNQDRSPGIWIYPGGRNIHYRHRSIYNRNEGTDISQDNLPELGTAWFRVAYTVNDNVMTGYIDGQQKAQMTLPNGDKFVWGEDKSKKKLSLFASGWPTDGGLMIRNMTFYNEVLTPTQIQRIMI